MRQFGELETRLSRLAVGKRGLGRSRSLPAGVGIRVAFLGPLALAAGQALAVAWEGICLLG
jgi:hypothetical protein